MTNPLLGRPVVGWLVHEVPFVLSAASIADDVFRKKHQDFPPKVAKWGVLPVSPVDVHDVPFVEV
jgi:hypothetical protein